MQMRTEAKPTILLFNLVLGDGIGDLWHLIDVYEALKNDPKYNAYDIVPVIKYNVNKSVPPGCSTAQIEKMKSIIKSRNLQNCFFSGTDQVDISPELVGYLKQAEKAFVISHRGFDAKVYSSYFPENIQREFIGEHESGLHHLRRPEGYSNFSLGLGEGLYGLKLKNIERCSPKDALLEIQKENSVFVSALIKATQTDLQAFKTKNTLIPAYFNEQIPFIRFIDFLCMQNNPIKNPAIYLSGISIDDQFVHNLQIELEEKSIGKLEIIQPGKETYTLNNSNAQSGKTVRIFSGYDLSDTAYKALYQQASIAGVSGDNSFELSISCGVLPFYHSTNSALKGSTLTGLLRIIKNECDFKDKRVIENFERYFAHIPDLCNFDQSSYLKDLNTFWKSNFDVAIKELNGLDVQVMLENWHKVIEILKKKYNFYDRLKELKFKYAVAPDLENTSAEEKVHFSPPPVKTGSSEEKILPESATKISGSSSASLFKPITPIVLNGWEKKVFLNGKTIRYDNKKSPNKINSVSILSSQNKFQLAIYSTYDENAHLNTICNKLGLRFEGSGSPLTVEFAVSQDSISNVQRLLTEIDKIEKISPEALADINITIQQMVHLKSNHTPSH